MTQRQTNRQTANILLDPSATMCTCNQSVCLPAHPLVHCPKCHLTYICRSLGYPRECPCGYPLWKWRLRNNIPELNPAFP